MTRHIDATAVGRILESILFLRSARLTGLVNGTDSPAFPSRSLTHSKEVCSKAVCAVHSAQDYLRDSILDAVEIEAPPSALGGSALTAVQNSLAMVDKDTTSSSIKAWQPRREIGSVLEGRDLHHMDLSGVRLSASFNRSNLAEAILIGSYFAHCTFNSCVLHNADLSGAQFHSCTFVSADASGVTARRAHFSHCTFHRADLCDWDAGGATFFQCSFTMSDLSRWRVNGQTTVIKPTDWGRCRRLDWQDKQGGGVNQCRVVGDANAVYALSIGPASKSACQWVFKNK